MGRMTVILSDDVEAFIEANMLSKSKLVRRGIDLALAEVRSKRDAVDVRVISETPGEPAGSPVAASPAPEAPATPPSASDPAAMACRYIDGTPWYPLSEVCFLLGITPDAVLNQLDDEAVIIEGETCIAEAGMREAMAVAVNERVPQHLIDKFEAWLELPETA